jgi:hypothetical protein
MSKWINDDLFGQFQDQKKEEKERPKGGVRRSDFVWQTPEKGTETVAKVYSGRFLPDPNGNFYKQYYYHMYRSGDKWQFVICPKTDNFENFCPFCTVTSKLYMGTAADKKLANNYKRKRKYVGNFFIVDDPRDADRDDEHKVNGTSKLYEFPNKVEMKLKEEITDHDNGLGAAIFDPSEEGFNFILKVQATKKDEHGNSWPDYGNSTFSRRPTALGTDAEIEEIMKSTIDINEYIDGLKKTDEEILKLLKDEQLFELVQSELVRYQNTANKQEESSEPETAETVDESPFKTDEEMKEETSTDNLESDDELLKELDSM